MQLTRPEGDLEASDGPGVSPAPDEQTTRARLGIPEDAERVLLLTESSHWDPNWMLTSEQYFRLGVRHTLDRVLDELTREPRRVWSADCVFFLAMYWDRRPDRREKIASLVNEGRIRLTTSGVTTQDTLLPLTESILRDFLIGQEWLRSRGMHQESSLAYFPDSFGHSPALPTLVRSAGFDRVMVTRIDGAYFVGTDWELPGRFPRTGSSAQKLTEAGSSDFLWRDRSGAEVLTHWHPFTYGQGDLLASAGLIRYMSAGIAIPARSEGRVAGRIEKYAKQHRPLSRTPYALCPIGLDFVDPIRDLWSLIDRYNQRRYPDTGIWVTNAGADDYFDLIDGYREDLPVIEMDPNPYWTGFYASRPELKRSHRLLVEELLATEAEAVAAGPAIAQRCSAALAEPWWVAATANHHDFVTGTSPDRVVRREQEPWLRTALEGARRAGFAVSDRGVLDVSADAEERPARETSRPTGVPEAVGASVDTMPGAGAASVWVEQIGALWRVDTGRIEATIDPSRGGCITSLTVDGTTVPGGLSGELIAYADSGGLWRMGNEYRGGHLRVVDRSSLHPARVTTRPGDDGSLVVVIESELDGIGTERRLWFRPGDDSIHLTTTCAAGERRTVTLAVHAGRALEGLQMDQPGGVVSRPVQRHFDPTFWPVSTWMCAEPPSTGSLLGGWSLWVDMTRAVAARPDGTMEVVVARNATKEKAWGVIPILACPARGHEPGETIAEVMLSWFCTGSIPDRRAKGWTVPGDHARQRLAAAVAQVVTVEPFDAGDPPPPVEIVAMKPATRGDGIVLRLVDTSGAGHLKCRLLAGAIEAAAICDVRERDTEPLHPHPEGAGSVVRLDRAAGIASVRLVPAMATA